MGSGIFASRCPRPLQANRETASSRPCPRMSFVRSTKAPGVHSSHIFGISPYPVIHDCALIAVRARLADVQQLISRSSVQNETVRSGHQARPNKLKLFSRPEEVVAQAHRFSECFQSFPKMSTVINYKDGRLAYPDRAYGPCPHTWPPR